MKSIVAISLIWAAVMVGGIRPSNTHPQEIKFIKKVLADRYISEGIAITDVNKDGKLDLMAGNLWFEGPAGTRHEIAPELKLDPAVDKSNSYVNFASDIDGDGWMDQILIGRPGNGASWRRNPGRSSAPWQQFPLWRAACNESPHFSDLFDTGKPVLVFAYDHEYMAWFEPARNPELEFESHPISEKTTIGTHKWAHGLGIGDINGDKRKDVICKDGYWEAPSDRSKSPWRFVAAKLGPDCGQMYVYDVNADGLPDVVSSSAHAKGVWWYEQKRGAAGPEFVQHTIDSSYSQTHAMAMADLNRDGIMDFVTGKRFWAHGPKGDVEPNHPAVLYWYELSRKDGRVQWTPHLIDSDSGVGVQFEIADVNRDGLQDIVTANRKGIFYFEQKK